MKTRAPVSVSSEPSPWLKLLIYGQSGSTKTRLACSAAKVPEMQPCLVFAFDNSMQSVDWKIPQIIVPDYATFKEALKEVDSGKYKTVIWDTLTDYYQILLAEAMRQAKVDSATKGRAHDSDLPEQRDYYRAHELFRKSMREMRDKPFHFIATAQRAYAVDQVTNEMLGQSPSISGKLNYEIIQFFWLVGQLEVSRTLRDKAHPEKGHIVEFHTETQHQVESKDRTHQMPGILEDTDMPEIWSFLFPKREVVKAKTKK